MTVKANCIDCGSEHPLGARELPKDSVTTVCPDCGSTSYTSEVVGERPKIPTKPLEENLRGIDGVGDTIIQNIKDRKLSLYDLKELPVEQLVRIPGVGRQTAENIKEQLQ